MIKNWRRFLGVDDTPQDGKVRRAVSSNWAYDHAHDLDAHLGSPFQYLRIGEYFPPFPFRQTAATAYSANVLYAVPFVACIRDITIDRIAIFVTVADAVNPNVRLGIYNDGTNLYPGTLLNAGGVVDVSSTGVKAVTIDQALTKGSLYWLALLADGTPTIQYCSAAFPITGMAPATFASIQEMWQISQAYGALPDPFPTGSPTFNGSAALIGSRLKSLD